MTISIVASTYNNLIVGSNGTLACKLSEDLKYFKLITTNVKDSIVIMGRKTWFSIPLCDRPLQDRQNIVLTNNQELLKCKDQGCKFMTVEKFKMWYNRNTDVFIIGGAQIYNLFLQTIDPILMPSRLYITEMRHSEKLQCTTKIDYIPKDFNIISHTKKEYHGDISYRYLIYKRQKTENSEEIYLNLLKDVLTSTGAISVFGRQTRMDISQSVPLLTSKYLNWKACIEELLWFLRGDTDSKILERKGVNIWKENTSREFIETRNLDYKEGIIGPAYGWNWRFFGARYSEVFSDTSIFDTSKIGGVDQIENIIHLLKTDPFSRRIVLSSWNPIDIDKCVLPPCHYTCTFYVDEDSSGQKHLSCHYIMRSNDLFLGAPWNIFSYTVLTYILAMKCDMKPKELVYSVSDAHIYNNHIEQVITQLQRTVRAQPKLVLNDMIKNIHISNICVGDFDVIGYYPDKSIHGEMAV
jgi:thymidylate synthase